MYNRYYYFVNAITLYRLITSPLLIYLALDHHPVPFRWLLAVSFFTDAIDGTLSRRLKVTSIWGAKLDSIADDLTIVAAMTGMMAFYSEFLNEQLHWILLLLGLFLVEHFLALVRYGKMTSFHTYMAKLAAILQGSFFLLLFFESVYAVPVFYMAVFITGLDLLEEIFLVLMLPMWRTDVKGIYWIHKKRKKEKSFN